MVEEPATPNMPQVPPENVEPKAAHTKRWLIVGAVIVVLAVGALGMWYMLSMNSQPKQSQTTATPTTTEAEQQAAAPELPGLQLDTKKDYGNKYANGIVPVGDSKYVTDAAKQGYIYMCNANFVPANQAGAQTRGPWFTNNNTQYDLNKKAHVQGSVNWAPSMSNAVSGSTRTISTNDLPTHITGIFPVGNNDPAHAYDRNPNSIKSQSLTYALNAKPTYGTPQCMGGEVGVMLTGAALFNGFDAGGRDAGAWEVQDSCDGHPQNKGEYHYHSLSSCITNISVRTVLGFALDGFPITGPKVGENNILTTSDLDECHGITSQIVLDGTPTTMYHYVMTQDFPYSASCFRSAAAQPPR